MAVFPHRCRCWSRWCGICPCKTPPRWLQTWQWRRKATVRSEAGAPWLSWSTSARLGDLEETKAILAWTFTQIKTAFLNHVKNISRMTYWESRTPVWGVAALSQPAAFAGQSRSPLWPGSCAWGQPNDICIFLFSNRIPSRILYIKSSSISTRICIYIHTLHLWNTWNWTENHLCHQL